MRQCAVTSRIPTSPTQEAKWRVLTGRTPRAFRTGVVLAHSVLLAEGMPLFVGTRRTEETSDA